MFFTRKSCQAGSLAVGKSELSGKSNPERIESISPALTRGGYAGRQFTNKANPERVASCSLAMF
jgi:hypothetical protein